MAPFQYRGKFISVTHNPHLSEWCFHLDDAQRQALAKADGAGKLKEIPAFEEAADKLNFDNWNKTRCQWIPGLDKLPVSEDVFTAFDEGMAQLCAHLKFI